jgi:hypothetical protein|tara:strand:+ start:405 stop:761 length:357 start_codon:yes stop_codon:yes gene_type:complete
MKITKSKLRQIIMEELEKEQEAEAPMSQASPEMPAAPPPSPAAGRSMTAGLPAVANGDFEGMAHAALAAIVQLAAEAGVEMDISSGDPAEAPAMEPAMQEDDISLAELKKLIKSELLG